MFEVNCHSLFSKWFSESGKLVMKLFTHIAEIAEDPECFVVLLIDEVESIASARSMSSKSGEPGDAIRVVNAVLTSLDSLKRKKNILVLCTSNMVTSLDEVKFSFSSFSFYSFV
jgi:SpoVK/Ycf46/Vps4 family AAA+-type ATPase